MNDSKQLADAIKHFWRTRLKQAKHQGSTAGVRDTGNKTAVTGGVQLDSLIQLLAPIARSSQANYVHKRHALCLNRCTN